MDTNLLYHGLLDFVAFVAFVVLHEFAHAWVADKCGDDTPRQQGRLTLDPVSHIDLIGTIILPLAVTLVSVAGGRAMLFGWGKPVMVTPSNFRHRRHDDILVSAAGPAMNLLIAFLLLVVMKVLEKTGSVEHLDTLLNLARLSMFLCMFNLLPVPPLDGGHIMRNLVGISDEAYAAMSQYSFMFFIVIMRVPEIGMLVNAVTDYGLSALAYPFGWHIRNY